MLLNIYKCAEYNYVQTINILMLWMAVVDKRVASNVGMILYLEMYNCFFVNERKHKLFQTSSTASNKKCAIGFSV